MAPASLREVHGRRAVLCWSGDALPKPVMEAARNADAILFGAMGWPTFAIPMALRSSRVTRPSHGARALCRRAPHPVVSGTAARAC